MPMCTGTASAARRAVPSGQTTRAARWVALFKTWVSYKNFTNKNI